MRRAIAKSVDDLRAILAFKLFDLAMWIHPGAVSEIFDCWEENR